MGKRSAPSTFERLRQSAAAKSGALAPMRGAPTGFTVDFRDIPDPARTYYAQECWAELDRGIVGIFFAQKSRESDQIRSLVCIRMAPMYVVHWIEGVDEIHSPTISEIATRVGAQAEKLAPIKDEAEQFFESSANIVKTGMSGHDVTLDFIKISPFSILTAQSGKVKAEPQIRIDTRASLFLGLIELLKEMSKSFPPESLAKSAK